MRVCFRFSRDRDAFLTITMRGEETGGVWECIGCYSLPCPFITKEVGEKGRGCLDFNFHLVFNHNMAIKKMVGDTDGTVDINGTKHRPYHKV